MTRMTPEIDRLIWAVAESNSDNAKQEFIQRYPEFEAELQKRLGLVRGLKANRPTPASAPVKPAFRPRARPVKSPSWLQYTLGALSLGAVITLGYLGARAMTTPQAIRPVETDVQVRPGSEPRPAEQPQETSPSVNSTTEIPNKPSVINETPPSTQLSPAPEPASWQKVQNIHVSDAPLQTVMKLVAMKGGIKLEIAPGTQNPQISYHSNQKNAIEILKDLGATYGFTPLLDGEDTVIAIPVVTHPANPVNELTDLGRRTAP